MIWAKIASLFMALGVLIGAFGAHALSHKLTEEHIDIFKTGVLYHFFHSLGLFAVSWLLIEFQNPVLHWVGSWIAAGILLFSGSLYAYALTRIRWLGFVTPLGGMCFVVGWILLFFNIP